MPRGLAGRIALAFGGLALAILVAVGATLFVVLTRAYTTDEQSSLVSVGVALASRPNVIASGRLPVETLLGPRSEIRASNVSVYVARTGSLELIAGPDAGLRDPGLTVTSVARTTTGAETAPGGRYLYGAVVFGAAARASSGLDAVLVAAPDDSRTRALVSLLVALVAVLVALVVIGAPIAWLLSRSVTRPIRRLQRATEAASQAGDTGGAARPAGTGELPLEGPAEVRDLTANFNRMTAELAATRVEEEQILANLRHDLRTPLTSIAGFAEAVADGTVSGEEARSAGRTIVEESLRLERLVAELGFISRLRQGSASLRPEQLDAAELLRLTATRFEGAAGSKAVSIGLATLPAAPPPFAADRLAVERIMQNLVVNALEAVGPGGHVWLHAGASRLARRAPGVLLQVTDDGPGFPPGTAERVFERFFRADPSRSGPGSGLGLAIVRDLARAHGGEAWAENVAPHGARLSVYLPAVPVGQPATAPRQAPGG